VVALGGGHGLATTLEAARTYAGSLTAVVSVADDGGSSGRLRETFGIPAPGDLRRCLVAMAGQAGAASGDERSDLWARAFSHRFSAGELEGHALGNLIITGLTEATGDFILALEEAGRLLGVDGQVLPATSGPVALKADVGGRPVVGQVRVKGADGPISRVAIVPPDAAAPPQVVSAILDADQVVIGPGSLFTSVLAVCVVPEIRAALDRRRADRIYVCNLRPQAHETDGYSAGDHLAALRAHQVPVDVMVVDPAGLPEPDGKVVTEEGADLAGVRVVSTALSRPDGLGHDPQLLGRTLATLAGASVPTGPG
jgi:uncharacterized cofD-like protein